MPPTGHSTDAFDTIVIGSGIGGLTAAALLARVRGERVLVVEQHHQAGGFTHTFERKGWEWDVGLHYVGDMGEGSFPRRISDLVSGGRLHWEKLPEPFDHYSFPGVAFAQRSGQERFVRDLTAAFPESASAIAAYFREVGAARGWGVLGMATRILPAGLSWIPRLAAWTARRHQGRTLRDCLDDHIDDPQLAAVLAGQCGDHGLPPGRVSLFAHALITHHFSGGGYYPRGGPSRIAIEIARTISELGGEVRTSCEVTEIVIEGRRVRGVKLRHTGADTEPRFIPCAKVISAAGTRQTWLGLVPRSVQVPFREELEGIEPGTTMVSAYLGLDRSPRALGLDGGNRWIFATLDLDEVYEAHARLPDGPAIAAFLSFPSLKDPLCQGPHTAQILAPVPYALFADWEGTRLRRRGEDYERLKSRIIDRLLELVESRHPGFRETVAYAELSSPLSIVHYSRHHMGEVYGLPSLPNRFDRQWLGPRTPIKGLYMAGADVLAHGMVGAMSGGLVAVTATQNIVGVSAVFRALLRASPAPADTASDHPPPSTRAD